MRTLIVTTFLCVTGLQAQLANFRIPVADQKVTDQQAGEIAKALRAVNFEAKEVVFPIFAGREQIAYGVSIGDERLLTKASEVTRRRLVFTKNRDHEDLAVEIVGTYPEHDLAILKVPGLKAPAAKWTDADLLEEGTFLATIGTDGSPKSLGVLSVRERSLKGSDQGFLGIIMMNGQESEDGVIVGEVIDHSAAAEVGLRKGDVIRKVDEVEIRGSFELSTKLRRLKSGDQPEIEILRGGESITVKPKLKGRDIESSSPRLNQMDRMSGTQSRVRGNFENVIQSDMALEANDAGLPVVDLEGRIVGMVIARAGRISTLILPGDDIAKLLETEPLPYAQPRRMARQRLVPNEVRRRRVPSEFELMERMMEELLKEMERD